MTRAIGRDISKWDFPYKPGTDDFVIQRLSYGTLKDERLAELTPLVMQAPVKAGYHYYTSGSRWQDQCDLFLNMAGGKYDFLALDVEKIYNTNSSVFISGIVPMLTTMQAQTHKPVLLYVNPDTWSTWLYPIQKDLLKFDIWLAQYWFLRNASNPSVPKTMTQGWKIWQWSDRPYDQDVFNGSASDLMTWAHPTPPPALECPTCGAVMPTGWSYKP
jgi:hypothetical protein